MRPDRCTHDRRNGVKPVLVRHPVQLGAPTVMRGLGLLAAASIVIFNMIGPLFLKARVMTCNVETPGLVIAVWVVAGLLTLAGALTLAELGTMMSSTGQGSAGGFYLGDDNGVLWILRHPDRFLYLRGLDILWSRRSYDVYLPAHTAPPRAPVPNDRLPWPDDRLRQLCHEGSRSEPDVCSCSCPPIATPSTKRESTPHLIKTSVPQIVPKRCPDAYRSSYHRVTNNRPVGKLLLELALYAQSAASSNSGILFGTGGWMFESSRPNIYLKPVKN